MPRLGTFAVRSEIVGFYLGVLLAMPIAPFPPLSRTFLPKLAAQVWHRDNSLLRCVCHSWSKTRSGCSFVASPSGAGRARKPISVCSC